MSFFSEQRILNSPRTTRLQFPWVSIFLNSNTNEKEKQHLAELLSCRGSCMYFVSVQSRAWSLHFTTRQLLDHESLEFVGIYGFY